jgi:RNA polymerase sigma factor (sigma-70 family)
MASDSPSVKKQRQQTSRFVDAVSVDKKYAELYRLLDLRSSESLRLLGMIRSMLFNTSLDGLEARDILAEAGVRAWQTIERGQSIRYLYSWLAIVSRRIIVDKLRQQKKHQLSFYGMIADIQDIPDTNVSSLEEDEESTLLQEKLHEAFKQLEPQEREYLEMRYIQDMTWPQIAQTLSERGNTIKETTLRQRGARALKKLRQILLDGELS